MKKKIKLNIEDKIGITEKVCTESNCPNFEIRIYTTNKDFKLGIRKQHYYLLTRDEYENNIKSKEWKKYRRGYDTIQMRCGLLKRCRYKDVSISGCPIPKACSYKTAHILKGHPIGICYKINKNLNDSYCECPYFDIEVTVKKRGRTI